MSEGRHAALIFVEKGFHWRGRDITRLEAFSDTVFGFAVALLVVSLEVPRSFGELMNAMRGFVAFAICFALLVNVWYHHYRFFRRYGIDTPYAVFLNSCLLFFILFYVYPLKYLFVGLLGAGTDLTVDQVRLLYVVYGLGYAAVFATFALLYAYAWSLRDTLDLTPLERLKTRHSLIDECAMVAIGLASAAIAMLVPENALALAGAFYFSIGIYFWIAGTIFGRSHRRLGG